MFNLTHPVPHPFPLYSLSLVPLFSFCLSPFLPFLLFSRSFSAHHLFLPSTFPSFSRLFSTHHPFPSTLVFSFILRLSPFFSFHFPYPSTSFPLFTLLVSAHHLYSVPLLFLLFPCSFFVYLFLLSSLPIPLPPSLCSLSFRLSLSRLVPLLFLSLLPFPFPLPLSPHPCSLLQFLPLIHSAPLSFPSLPLFSFFTPLSSPFLPSFLFPSYLTLPLPLPSFSPPCVRFQTLFCSCFLSHGRRIALSEPRLLNSLFYRPKTPSGRE